MREELIQRICDEIDKRKKEIIDFTLSLVKEPSENPPGDECKVVELIIKKCKSWGLPQPEIWCLEAHRPNLIVRIKGDGRGRSLILNAHTDTKPVGDVTEWSVDPGKPRILNGKLYGRGSADMKGSVAGILAAAMAIIKGAIPFNGELIIALTADEEAGSRFGVKVLIDRGLIADAMLITEPSGMKKSFDSLGLACRGAVLGKVVVHGTQMHSSLSDQGGCINASVKMAEVLMEFAVHLKEHLTYESHSLYPGGPTVNPGVILEGGVFYGVIPGKASFGFDLRIIPGMTLESVKKDIENFLYNLQKSDNDLKAELIIEAPPIDWFPSVEIERSHPLVYSCVEAAEKVLGISPNLMGVPFSTDGIHYAKAGIDMPIVSSFGPGLIKLAHAPDEYIEVQSVVDSAKIFAITAINYLMSS
ncbi:MAG: M20 family metallopeptidase [Spirochaetota bacterium]|nr:MAG: M20 family metallopeptidase [Spirochaetota bacterium]